MAPFPIAFGHDQRPLAARPVGDEDLPAVDDELVPVAAGDRRDPRHVRARIRLGDRQGRDLLAPDRRHHPLPLLLLGAELEHRRRRHLGLHGDGHAEPAAAGASHLLGQHDRGEVVAALAAVLRRVAQAQEAELAEPPEDLVGEGLLLPLLEVRLDLLLQELADVQPQLLVGVGEVHRLGVYAGNGRRSAYGMIRGRTLNR